MFDNAFGVRFGGSPSWRERLLAFCEMDQTSPFAPDGGKKVAPPGFG
jgi:hypothetical protein